MKPIGWVAVGGAGLLGYWYLLKRGREMRVTAREMITDANGQEEIDVTAEVRRRTRRGARRRARAARQGGTVDVTQFDLIAPNASDIPELNDDDIIEIDPEVVDRVQSGRDAWFAQYGITAEQWDRAASALRIIRERNGMTAAQINAQEQQCAATYGFNCAIQMAISAAQGAGYYA